MFPDLKMNFKLLGVMLLHFGLCELTTAIPKTMNQDSRLTNGRLCPEEKFFHNETKGCYFPTRSLAARYEENVLNPCGPLQHFYQVLEEYGKCDCVWDDPAYGTPGCSGEKIDDRPVLNWSGSKKCYHAYSQGPCKSGQWIVMNRKTYQSECQPNPCQNLLILEPKRDILNLPRGYVRGGSNIEIFHFLKNNTCYQTYTQAFCGHNEHVRFRGTNPTPTCFEDALVIPCVVAATNVATLPCSQGFKRIGNDCVATAEFD